MSENTYCFKVSYEDEEGSLTSSDEIEVKAKSRDEAGDFLDSECREACDNFGHYDFSSELTDVH